jgi:hypothetical protein
MSPRERVELNNAEQKITAQMQMDVLRAKFEVIGVELKEVTYRGNTMYALSNGGAPWLSPTMYRLHSSKDAAIIAFFRRLSKQSAEAKARRAAGEN